MNTLERPVFVITVDTEEEWNWHGPFPKPPFSTRNIERVPKFQALCATLGLAPTYFVDQAVAENNDHADLLKSFLERGECDVGAHLHPWCTPPIDEEISAHNSHALNLGVDVFRAKMMTLTALLEQQFGVHPLSFRSGRWGMSGPYLQVLAELGYQLDSSVRPFYSDSCFSYQKAPTRVYKPSFVDILEEDPEQNLLVEVPVSSGFNHAPFEFLNTVHGQLSKPPLNRLRLIGILWALKLMRKITVTPEGHDAADVCRCMDMCIQRGDRIINMFFHSSDLLPGNTDYVKTDADEARFYQTIQRCAEHARQKHNAEFLTMRQIHERLVG